MLTQSSARTHTYSRTCRHTHAHSFNAGTLIPMTKKEEDAESTCVHLTLLSCTFFFPPSRGRQDWVRYKRTCQSNNLFSINLRLTGWTRQFAFCHQMLFRDSMVVCLQTVFHPEMGAYVRFDRSKIISVWNLHSSLFFLPYFYFDNSFFYIVAGAVVVWL